MNKRELYLSNDKIFGVTLEGEGKFVGYPSIFLRMYGCNLRCPGFISESSPHGCDSYVSWSVKNVVSFDDAFKMLEENQRLESLKHGAILKLTGGEPLIFQKGLEEFIEEFIQKYKFVPKIDFETNATLTPNKYWADIGATFTTSPKLRSNGDPEEKTYKPDVLKWHVQHGSCFKFVVRNEDDITEIYEKYINGEPKVPTDRVWLMPCAGSRNEHLQVQGWVADACKRYNFKFSPRLHLLIWDKALAV